MKHLLLKSTLFLSGLWLFLITLASFSESIAPMNVYSKSSRENLVNLLEHGQHVEAISLGNSHGAAVDFETLGMNGQILTRAGTDIFEIEKYATSVTPKLPELHTVFLSISYFSFTRNNILFDDTRNLRTELYAMLPTWKPLPGDETYLILGKLHRYFRLMSVVRPDSWNGVITNLLNEKGGNINEESEQLLARTPWGECYHYSKTELDEIANEIARKAATNHQTLVSSFPNIPDDAYLSLSNTIEHFQSNGVRVILFTPPYYVTYNKRFNSLAPGMISQTHTIVKDLQNKYGIEYYDYSNYTDISTHPELFFNSDHLNDCGRKAFSEILLSEISNPKFTQ